MEIHYVGNQVCLQRIIFVHRAAAPTLSCSASIACTGFGDLICFSPKSKFNWVQDVLIFAFPKLIGFPKLSGLRMLQGFFSNCRCKQWMSDSAFCARLHLHLSWRCGETARNYARRMGWKHKFGNMFWTNFNQRSPYWFDFIFWRGMFRKQSN